MNSGNNNKVADTESESKNKGNKDVAEDGFRKLAGHSFLESDKSGYRSENYIGGETDDEEDSEDEDQGDDHC